MSLLRRPRFRVSLVASLLLASGTLHSFGFNNHKTTSRLNSLTSASPITWPKDENCISAFSSFVSVSTIHSDGTSGPAVRQSFEKAKTEAITDRTSGRMYHFSLNGSVVDEPEPPASWSPITGTASSLRTYGFPPRPTQPAALHDWLSRFSAWRPSAPVPMCVTNKRAQLTNTTSDTQWAGGMNEDGSATRDDYYSSDGGWVTPSFDSSCSGHSSSYVIWAGLGGYAGHGGRLIQSGAATQTSLTTMVMWWELIAPNHGQGLIDFANSTVKAGDNIESYNEYYNGKITMSVFDNSSNPTAFSRTVTLSSYDGLSASGYYDGTTSDFVTEAPQGGSAPGGNYYLRKPHGYSVRYFRAETNGNSLNTYHSWALTPLLGPSTRNVLQNASFDGVHGWYNSWVGCS